jgi:pSer/pThr/pTyr-binding forkhead associated (FHA) protein
MSEQSKEAFAQACGLAGALELLVRRSGEPGSTRHKVFGQPFVVIGRDPRCELCLEAAEVSRQHAYFQVISGHLYCLDLESRTGTHWEDGSRSAGWLAPGHTVRIGPFDVCLVRVGQPADEVGPLPDWSPTETRLEDSFTGPFATLEFAQQEQLEGRCRLTRILTLIGRSSLCQLHLKSPRVAKFHAGLVRTRAGVWVVDLHSRPGTRVGGTLLPWAPLQDGDRLTVGPFTIRIRGTALVPSETTVLLPAPAPLVTLPQRVVPEAAMLGPVVQQMTVMQQQLLDQFQQAMLAMVQVFGTLQRDQMRQVREELGRLRNTTEELQSLRVELARQQPAGSNGRALPGPDTRPRQMAAEQPGAPETLAKAEAPAPGELAAAPAPNTDGTIHVWLSERIAALEQEQQSRWQKVMSFVLGK